MEALRMQVLGPVRAWHGDSEVDLGTARSRAVLAALALRPGRVVTRRELVAAVWGEDVPNSADGLLNTYVSGLRRALEPDRAPWAAGTVLVSEPGGYELRITRDAVDAHRFTALHEEGETQFGTGGFQAAARAFDAACRLWRGEALSGLSGPDAESQRVRLRELLLAARERRAEAVLAHGGRAVAELRVLVAQNPLRERASGLLMLALHREGRSAEALEVYRKTRELLVRQLGIEPGAALRSWHAAVLADEHEVPAAHPSWWAGGAQRDREPEVTR